MESSELLVVARQRDISSSGVSWGAVIAGAFVAAALSLIGAATQNAETEQPASAEKYGGRFSCELEFERQKAASTRLPGTGFHPSVPSSFHSYLRSRATP